MSTSGHITEKEDYRIERLSRDKIEDLAKLHEAVYAAAPANNYYDLKYDTAYTKVEYAGFIAYHPCGEPIAYYGVIPCFIEWNKEIILAAQSADTMTHPKHRFKGMFMQLANKTFELCRQLNIKLIFGFPNQNSYHGFIKLGWKKTESLECFIIPVDSLPLHSISSKIGILKIPYEHYKKQVLKKILLDVNGIKNSVITDGFAGVLRSDDYVKYKTYSKTKVITIAGAKIWMTDKHALVVGDMEDVNEKNFNNVIDELKSVAKKMGFKQIQFHSSSGTSLNHLFSGICKASPSFPVLFLDCGSPVPLEKIKFTFADIDIF